MPSGKMQSVLSVRELFWGTLTIDAQTLKYEDVLDGYRDGFRSFSHFKMQTIMERKSLQNCRG